MKITIIIILITSINCSKDPLDKPIYQPLTIEELSESLDKNPDW